MDRGDRAGGARLCVLVQKLAWGREGMGMAAQAKPRV